MSWIVLEPGHKVVAAGGEEVGQVEELLGDSVADIFDGLTISTGVLGKAKYVPSEIVSGIDTDAVHLTISAADVDRLDEYSPPAVDAS
jgi:hypothetical protein